MGTGEVVQPGAPELALVSIGVPVYNGAEFLSDALMSALDQDYPALEVINCDNASTHDTEAICRRFEASDPRVRYLRNETNVGPQNNFRRVLHESRGTYFTWLAHDDLLSDRTCIRLMVEHLEQHPDVVVCASAFTMLDFEGRGSSTVRDLPEIAASAPWPEARKQFFLWPQTNASYAVYGVFRRDAALKTTLSRRPNSSRPLAAMFWVTTFMAEMSVFGRIVALPEPLRSYRLVKGSWAQHWSESVSPLVILLVGIRVKLQLIQTATRTPGSISERLDLLRITLRNLFRANFRRPTDYRRLIEERRREWTTLQRAARDRANVLRNIQHEIEKRRESLLFSGRDISEDIHVSESLRDGLDTENRPLGEQLARLERERPSLRDFFRPTPGWQVALSLDVGDEIGRLRGICDRQLVLIDALNREAEALLLLMQTLINST